MTSTRRLVAVNLPYAGLGNRLRFTLSAQAVAEAEGRAFSYAWPLGKDFGADFTELWDFKAQRASEERGPYLTENDDLTSHRGEDTWTIRSAAVVRGDGSEADWQQRLAELPLNVDLQGQADRVREDGLTSYVGVQIRASEKTHAKTLETSPPSWFEMQMRASLDEDPSTRFFVSCDVADVQADLLRKFPSAVAIDKGGAGYNSGGAVRLAVVDLALLSQSTRLLGPYWSSFVEMAWIMGGKRQDLVTSMSVKRAVPRSSGE